MSVIRSDELETDAELVRALAEGLDDDEKTILLVLLGCSGTLPYFDISGRFSKLGYLRENGTLSKLGVAVAKEVLRNDPEAVDPEPGS